MDIVLASTAATWLINKLLDRLSDYAIKKLLGSEGLEAEASSLSYALQRARLVLGAVPAGAAAGTKIGNDQLLPQIDRVQRLATDLARHLDELEYYDVKKKVKKNQKSSNPLSKMNLSLTESGQSKPKYNRTDIKQIRDTVEHLHSICNDVHNALLLDKLDSIKKAAQDASSDKRETVENFTKNPRYEVIPGEEMKDILKLINSAASSDQELLVVPIVGAGGVGKTTLAQLVYEEVKAQFDMMFWIYVSANFDEVKLTQEILEQIPECELKNTKNLTVLQRGINKYLTKRFILVLDDMWEESEGRWDKLLAPLRSTQVKGNIILVTTRKLSVARITSNIEAPIILDGMKENVFFSFFKRCIFGDGDYQDQRKLMSKGDQRKLLNIAKTIATRLKGNPLAAKSVGTLLRRNIDEVYWRRILDSDEWRLQESIDDIIPALKLSYNQLPYRLQLLFSYCAMFPKGYNFDKGQLIRTWIALGFVMNERKKLEDEGSDCFEDLVDRSFFQRYGESQYYTVHDLMHDVAQEVSINKCLIIDGSDFRTVRSSICHLSIWTEPVYNEQSIERNDDFEEKLDAVQDNVLGSLESLILAGVYDENYSAKFVKTLERARYVRVLQLTAMPFNSDILLSSIKRLIHLRYLELRCTSDKPKSLPEAICKLYHLQVLDVQYWSGINDLPKDMSNLVNLRYLLVPGSGSLHSKISRVGELKFIQELKEFQVQEANGFEISQLGNINEIRGSLSILGLETVTKKGDATRARIKDKKHLRTLLLTWGSASGSTTSVQKEVMEGLKPHENLSHLLVFNYAGATPSWLGDNFSLKNLESLHLQDCAAVRILPPFEKMPFLKKLSLVGLPCLKNLRIDFNSAGEEDELELTEIEISKCSALTSIRLHSCKELTKLSINDCEALASLEGLPSSEQLKQYVVHGCPKLPSGSIPN
ncbi:unnamed protein product [Miscanthus lutarioriparius]|uniref:NB-ARC domain-containing protein n=1 Tax=Miscanthus lutarioriparius TaxID=422564 RepID=A0A811QHJ2_9POAL|nr:unnamed protein product [Miscanthus lutarioriparius]